MHAGKSSKTGLPAFEEKWFNLTLTTIVAFVSLFLSLNAFVVRTMETPKAFSGLWGLSFSGRS